LRIKPLIIISVLIAVFFTGALSMYLINLKEYPSYDLPPNPIKTGKTADNKTCVLETCHGLDITCGSNTAMACTMMYGIGDKCLQYAKCGVQNGNCQQIQNPQFTECKSCIQKCLETSNDDSVKLFDCESRCK